MRAAALALCATAALAAAPPASFDCAYRQLALDYGASLQPFRPAASWSQMADALAGAPEAQNCSLSLPAAPANASRFSYLPLPAAGTPNVYYIAAAGGADSNPGTQALPFATVERGLAAARAGAPAAKVSDEGYNDRLRAAAAAAEAAARERVGAAEAAAAAAGGTPTLPSPQDVLARHAPAPPSQELRAALSVCNMALCPTFTTPAAAAAAAWTAARPAPRPLRPREWRRA